jgi:CRP/FNR family cyclic AMP-dependent transcriptional regulator
MMNSRGIQPVMKSKGFGEMAVMDLRPRSASVQAIENSAAICLSAANLYRVYARDLKQFALIQMNMGREVCRRFRETDERLFCARMSAPGHRA